MLAARSIQGPLIVPCYDGILSITHPSVVDMGSAWNGYRYWMAFTPYPDQTREDPSIVASEHESGPWVEPSGIANPVAPLADTNADGLSYQSDPHLIAVGSELWLYYRGQNDGTPGDALYRRTSSDGITWSARTMILSNAAGDLNLLSPSVTQEEGGGPFLMWTCGDAGLHRRTSGDGVNWSAPTKCTLADARNPWHAYVVRDGGRHVALVATSGGEYRLYITESSDGGLTWGVGGDYLPLSGQVFDQNGHYRSSLHITESGRRAIHVSCRNVGSDWRLGYVYDVGSVNFAP